MGGRERGTDDEEWWTGENGFLKMEPKGSNGTKIKSTSQSWKKVLGRYTIFLQKKSIKKENFIEV